LPRSSEAMRLGLFAGRKGKMLLIAAPVEESVDRFRSPSVSEREG
jgi:hypothetical protein